MLERLSLTAVLARNWPAAEWLYSRSVPVDVGIYTTLWELPADERARAFSRSSGADQVGTFY